MPPELARGRIDAASLGLSCAYASLRQEARQVVSLSVFLAVAMGFTRQNNPSLFMMS